VKVNYQTIPIFLNNLQEKRRLFNFTESS